MKNLMLFCTFVSLLTLDVAGQKSAESQIVALHNGVLIVNLMVPQRKIEALESQGNHLEAQKLKDDAQKQNQYLMTAFQNYYTFSDVYFVYAKDLEKLTSGDGSVLFDAKNNRLSDVPPLFFMADLSGSPERNIEGLVVKDASFTPLAKPFPYFVSAWGLFHLQKRTEAEMVGQLNKNLKGYYAKVVKTK